MATFFPLPLGTPPCMVAFEMPPNATIQTYQDALLEYMNNSTASMGRALSSHQSPQSPQQQQREFHFTTQFNSVPRVDKNLSPNVSLQDTLRYSSLFIYEMQPGTKPCYSTHFHGSSYYDYSPEEKQASSTGPATYQYLYVDVLMAEEFSSYHQKVIAVFFCVFIYIFF